jgi:hypothetical protein
LRSVSQNLKQAGNRRARGAIAEFAREHGLESQIAALIADHEREQCELARDRVQQAGDEPG